MREELLDVHVPVRHELGAFGLALPRERPGATSVTCRRRRSGLTSSVTWPRSPTKQAVPHDRTERTAAARASGAEEASSVLWAPSPWVRSRIAATMSPDPGSSTSWAPNSRASPRRSGAMSMAMTRAPIITASCVADRPTGPWPKTAIVSPPCRLSLFRAPHAVPVPHEIAAPVTKESESGSGTSVDTGTFMYRAWPPCPPEPYTTVPSRHIWVQPARQCLQVPQPS